MSVTDDKLNTSLTDDDSQGADDRGDELVVEELLDDEVDNVAAAKKPKDEEETEEEEAPEDEGDEVEEDDEAPAKEAAKNTMIPRARLNKVQEKRKAAEARVAELEAQLAKQRDTGEQSKGFQEFTAKVDELYEKVEQARAEGDYKEAAKLQRELDTLRDNVGQQRAQYVARQAALRSQQEVAYNALVDQVELLAPELDPKHANYDEDLMDEVDTLTRSLEAQGMDAAKALRRALKYTLGRDIFDEKTIRRDTPPEPKKTNIAKNVAAAKKIPPEMSDAPMEKSTKIDFSKLTDAEYEKLPASVKQKARGDFV
jgi:uncharacterized coiled-coil protein SlyX